MSEKIIVSMCLLGIPCRYNGKALDKAIKYKEGMVPVCPEQLGGLSTPRPKSFIEDGKGLDVILKRCRVKNELGEDVTIYFLKGAEETLKITRLVNAKKAILKARSPSCGAEGVTTALLKKSKIKIEIIDP